MAERNYISYEDQTNKINNLLLKDSLSEEENYFLTSYAEGIALRQVLYNNDLASQKTTAEFKNALTLLQKMPTNSNVSHDLLEIYKNKNLEEIQNNANSQSQSNSISQTREKALVRTRTDGLHPPIIENDINENTVNNDNLGFTNIIFILAITISWGLILGTILIINLPTK